jgi:POT family proton-dependent oligopeptide transporter
MSKPADASQTKSGLRSFTKTFWTANAMELFERGAYYGMNALLARYLTDKVGGGLGFKEDEVGLLQSVVYAITYVIPILGGALADRYGYRRMLLIAFSLLSAGYFFSGQVTGYWVIFSTLLLMATGSGLFKPIISGTIARSTTEENSGFGFGVYYWMINLGALIAPLVAGYLRGFSWRYVFIASSLYCAAMLIPTIFIYRDPPKPENTKNLKEVLAGALTVLSDARFMLLIFVYSCFWILYFQMFGSVIWYMRDFVDAGPVNEMFAKLGIEFDLDAEHVTVINAGTIVLLQIVVSRVVKNIKPLPTMIGGILFGSAGFLCLALSQQAWIFILGIAVFSIGEMTCHPKYYSYIGIVAPADKKAVYMGYAFLYGVIGSLVGSNVGGEMYNSVLTPLKGSAGAAATLRNFWLVFAVLGVFTMFALVLYNRFFGKDNEDTRRRARTVMLVVYALFIIGAFGMLLFVYRAKGAVPVKTAIQSGIMFLVGIGGLTTLIRRRETDLPQSP